MEIVTLHEKLPKLCFCSTGDVVRLQEDGSGPYIVTTNFDRQCGPGANSGLFEFKADHMFYLVHLETGVARKVSLSTRVSVYPKAAVHLNKVV